MEWWLIVLWFFVILLILVTSAVIGLGVYIFVREVRNKFWPSPDTTCTNAQLILQQQRRRMASFEYAMQNILHWKQYISRLEHAGGPLETWIQTERPNFHKHRVLIASRYQLDMCFSGGDSAVWSQTLMAFDLGDCVPPPLLQYIQT